MKTNGGGGIATPFLTSALGEGEWSASHPGRFTLGERNPGTHWAGTCVRPSAGLYTVEKRNNLASARNPTTAVQPLARHYTEWTILTQNGW
jgi:hypothetical protein